MTLADFYRASIRVGIENDPRGARETRRLLEREKKNYGELKPEEKKEFDEERFKNPYADTRILQQDAAGSIKGMLVGIDIEVGELLLADRLREKGKRIDVVVAHHPEGTALAGFYDVMGVQADILERVGVPITVAEALLEGRIKEVERKVLPINHSRAVDVARLLGLPFICVHTPADNCAARYVQRFLDRKRPDTLGGVVSALKEIPEYRDASAGKSGPKIVLGSERKRTGKIFVDMTGGTEGPDKIFRELCLAGVGTVVGMHFQEGHVKEAEKSHVNLVVAGHISSDTLGLNLLLDEVLKRSGIAVIACSGFARVTRARS